LAGQLCATPGAAATASRPASNSDSAFFIVGLLRVSWSAF
jgi:hypothetical protein